MCRGVSWSLHSDRQRAGGKYKWFLNLSESPCWKLDPVSHLSGGVSLVPAGHLFGRSIGGRLVGRLVPPALALCGGSLGGGRPVDCFQVPCLGLLCQLLTDLPLNRGEESRSVRTGCLGVLEETLLKLQLQLLPPLWTGSAPT